MSILKKKLASISLETILSILILVGYFIYVAFNILDNYTFTILDDSNYIMPYLYEEWQYFTLFSRYEFEVGRFLPLQYLDYNILKILPIKYMEVGTFVFMIIKFAILLGIFVLLLKYLSGKERKTSIYIPLIFMAFFNYEICYLYLGIPAYSEPTICLMIFLFMYYYYKTLKTDNIYYIYFALLAASYSTYMKETMFVPYMVIGIVNLLFNKNSRNFKRLNIGLILNGVLFLGIYMIFVFPLKIEQYGGKFEFFLFLDNVKRLLVVYKLLTILFILSILKGIKVLFLRAEKIFLR